MKLEVLCAADGAPWEEPWVHALDRGPHAVRIARRCVDVVDLLAVAASGQGRAALIDAALPRLDADVIDRLVAAGVAPVAVVVREDEDQLDRVRAMGISFVVADDADPAVVASVLTEAVLRRGQGAGHGLDEVGTRLIQRSFTEPSTSSALPPGAGTPLPLDARTRRGRIVAVWGPTGAPGRSTVAVALADELARLSLTSLLVDADVYGGAIAALLGLLDESPGVAAACRQAGVRRLDAAALAALCWQLAPQFRVLTGIPLASRWPELRPAGLTAVLEAARELADITVVDTGFCLETDEELAFDTVAPRRNGATLAVLDAADLVVVVGSADPIGMQRLVRGLAELRDCELAAPVWVVVNRVRAGAVPGDVASEVIGALDRFAGVSPVALLPADQDAVDAAVARGQLLAEAAPRSPLRQAVIELAAAVAGVPVPSQKRRRRHRAG